MIATVHILIGTLIGLSLNNFFLIAILAFISHFLLDAIPHWDQGSFKRGKHDWKPKDWFLVFVDVVIGTSIALYLALRFEFWPVFIGVAFAIAPDVIDNLAWIFRWNYKPFFKKFQQIHARIGFHLTRDLLWLGILLEVAVLASILFVLFFV